MGLVQAVIDTLFSVSAEETKIEKRGFHASSPHIAERLETIGTSFLKGYHAGLKCHPAAVLTKILDGGPEDYCGFRYEGAGMGMAIMDFFRPKSKKVLPRFMANEGNHHIYMIHVGIGWAYARLPVNPDTVLDRYDPKMRWLIIDGYGFHQAYFKTKTYIHQRKLPVELKPYSRNVFYQGVGRCLWFIEGATPSRIANRIATFDKEYQSDLWSGTGLACLYAGGVNVQELKDLKSLSGQYLPYLLQGAAFGAKARERARNIVEYNEMAAQTLSGKSVNELAELSDLCENEVPEAFAPNAQYELWRSKIRDAIST